MSVTGGLIVYKIIGWKITTMKIKGGGVLEHPEHPPEYAPASFERRWDLHRNECCTLDK